VTSDYACPGMALSSPSPLLLTSFDPLARSLDSLGCSLAGVRVVPCPHTVREASDQATAAAVVRRDGATITCNRYEVILIVIVVIIKLVERGVRATTASYLRARRSAVCVRAWEQWRTNRLGGDRAHAATAFASCSRRTRASVSLSRMRTTQHLLAACVNVITNS